MVHKKSLETQIAGIIHNEFHSVSPQATYEQAQLTAAKIVQLLREKGPSRIIDAMFAVHDVDEFYKDDERDFPRNGT